MLSVFVWIQVFKNENCHGNSCSPLLQSSGSDADICGDIYALRVMCTFHYSGFFFPLTFLFKKIKGKDRRICSKKLRRKSRAWRVNEWGGTFYMHVKSYMLLNHKCC